MKDTFDINDCKLKGCHHNQKGTCRLDGLPVINFAESMQFFQDSSTCQLRKQINIFRTEELIRN